ncbi:hypothetical protein KKP97_02245 [Methanothermococcus sp. SCGC AD-155-C09]|nr:hypothetical protein [Methanothermococcus sp. SCGC AD-155-C09]
MEIYKKKEPLKALLMEPPIREGVLKIKRVNGNCRIRPFIPKGMKRMSNNNILNLPPYES